MAPQKYASVRYKSRPTALVPFRDDTSLVAFRYEQTIQAEPPIPIPPRNPRRSTRPMSSFSSSPAPASAFAPASSPIVVAPPPIAPPSEQHPAFRNTLPARPSSFNDWKRDSGLAPTTSSTTILEEDGDEEEDENVFLYDKFLDFGRSEAVPEPSIQDSISVYSTDEKTYTPPSPLSIASIETPDTSPPLPAIPTKKLAKSFSFRSASASRRLKKKSLSEDPAAAPMHPLLWGSPKDAYKSPKLSLQHDSQPASPNFVNLATAVDFDFSPLSIDIPTDSLLDDDFMTKFTFSKRGSVMFGGRRAIPFMDEIMESKPQPDEPATPPPHATPPQRPVDTEARPEPESKLCTPETAPQTVAPTPNIYVVAPEVELESQKVRSLYGSGDSINWEDGGRFLPLDRRLEPTPEDPSEDSENDAVSELPSPVSGTPRSANSSSLGPDSTVRREYELAGGIEDWEDVSGGDVDRYGFISARSQQSRAGTPTELKSAQFSPRRRNVLTKRDPSGLSSPLSGRRTPSRKVSARSLNTQNSEMSTASRLSTRSALRSAGNYLPHNRDRRWMDEAGDMLTLTPGLGDIMEDAEVEKISEELKKKEWERSEKWRKMAKVVRKGKDGEGMDFEFDVSNPKLIDRTWKGIPDRWRASAWYSFLATSAKNRKDSAPEEQVIADFHRLQEQSSPDDVQIDLDVPRTINRHIMFRRRYRGGQRLLFRVLHALSLYFPVTGYVQGMASLAATLLCYFDEEKCFVMLTRMWRLRGMEQLYQPGFEGLMTALKDFETQWLGGKDVAAKLSELSIDATAYGTRWYLTLFNLSIPFPAQLRVWDVFLLLGEAPPEAPEADSQATKTNSGPAPMTGIDIIHATSAALIHALREVLLDSDFENAMKALTSWVPVKDEDLLMRVTKAEWKLHQGKKKA